MLTHEMSMRMQWFSESHEVESAIPIAYSAWWNHQEDVGSIPTGDELSISDYRNLIFFTKKPLAIKIGAFAMHSWYIYLIWKC